MPMSLLSLLPAPTALSLALAALAAFVAYLLLNDWRQRWPLRMLPSPPGFPLIGHVHHLLSKPWIAFAAFAAEHGPVYLLRFWSRPFIVISDPDLVRQVFKDAKHKYVKDQWSYDFFRDILGQGLVTSEGAVWRAHRRLLSPAFHFAALERLHVVFDAAAARLVSELRAAAGARAAPGALRAALAADGALSRSDVTTVALGDGAALMELSSHFRRVTLEVISQVALGFDRVRAGVFPELFEAVLDELNQRPYKPWRAFLPHIERPHRARLRKLDAIVDALIASRRAERGLPGGGAAAPAAASPSPSPPLPDADDGVSISGREIFAGGRGDMLDMILDSDASLDDATIRDELKTQLFAGHETSSMLLTWACYLLAAHPAAYAAAQAEVDAVLGAGADAPPPSFEQFRALTYLEWVLREAMRVYTPVPILNRACVEADTLGGFPVTPGAGVIVSVWALHTSPALWGADVADFRPERFAPDEAKARHPWAYMPFSLGERNCIGQNLAMMEAKVVLGSLLRAFDISLPDGQPPPQTDSFVIPVRPHARLNLVVRPRR